MSHPLLIISQSDCLIQVVDANSHTEWQTVQIQISWLLQKPTDLCSYCFQRWGIIGFSRTRVKLCLTFPLHYGLYLFLQFVSKQERVLWSFGINSDFRYWFVYRNQTCYNSLENISVCFREKSYFSLRNNIGHVFCNTASNDWNQRNVVAFWPPSVCFVPMDSTRGLC